MTRRNGCSILLAVGLSVLALAACQRSSTPAPGTPAPPAPRAVTQPRPAPPVDAAPAGPEPALRIRVINASQQPLQYLTNEDTNELLHTRKLWSARRPPDAGGPAAGELVKFFQVGEMALCASDAGVGYGGLGQPEPRTLAPGQSVEFDWDGLQRVETVDAARGGVCLVLRAPERGRYRFEFDQPYNVPTCTRPVVELPLAPGAPRVVEIRCTPAPRNPES